MTTTVADDRRRGRWLIAAGLAFPAVWLLGLLTTLISEPNGAWRLLGFNVLVWLPLSILLVVAGVRALRGRVKSWRNTIGWTLLIAAIAPPVLLVGAFLGLSFITSTFGEPPVCKGPLVGVDLADETWVWSIPCTVYDDLYGGTLLSLISGVLWGPLAIIGFITGLALLVREGMAAPRTS